MSIARLQFSPTQFRPEFFELFFIIITVGLIAYFILQRRRGRSGQPINGSQRVNALSHITAGDNREKLSVSG